jgi:hypothetical protein
MAQPVATGPRAGSAPTPEPGAAAVPTARRATARATATGAPRRSRRPALALALAALCLLAAAGGGLLLHQRLDPPTVDVSVFQAARSGVEALYAFDYKHADQSIKDKLAVLTGDLREQYRKDLSQGGIVDAAKQVSATTRFDVSDVGLQQINDAQDDATLVVFGQEVTKSVNSGSQAAPQGSECTVTSDGAQSCVRTIRMHITQVNGAWKISELTVLTTS